MNILGYRFKPKIWTIVLMIFFVAIFSSLGRWQMSRADEKYKARTNAVVCKTTTYKFTSSFN